MMIDTFQTLLLATILAIVLLQTAKPRRKNLSNKSRIVILDTCALIDGRIVDLAKSGFVPDTLVIPEFILRELQFLADGNDSHKRERARFGLDVVKELQSSKYSSVMIGRDQIVYKQKVDDKLIELSKKMKAELYTTDYNLSKLAEIEGVRILNVNELAQQLRPIALPGERKKVKIVQKGSNPKQGVGYLEDGTMVVVDGAAKMIGKTINCEVSRIHQTVAGKMIFANILK
ncbi:TRAM domain-containing protein [Candidatus Saccharibacteria bacterium]|nr:TRAM domain-containing protein [Candidatus Saccharibacteria bacterium]